MQDNTLARSLRLAGADVVLIPTYTPIRVDEENVSSQRVFLGGLNVFLGSALPGWKYLPSAFTSWLDRPGVIRLLSQFSGSTDASSLGPLTVDLLRGTDGPQREAIRVLADFICDDLRPDIVLFSNVLLSGILPVLRSRFQGAILTMLQGDDIFLEGLPDQYRTQAVELINQNCRTVNGILTHSQYYADMMSAYLRLPPEKFHRIPLAIDTVLVEAADDPSHQPNVFTVANDDTKYPAESSGEKRNTFNIGYFARICPEKGIDRLLTSGVSLLQQCNEARILIGGFLPKLHRRWFLDILNRAQRLAGTDRIQWRGSPSGRNEKMELLKEFDLLCVPTQYHEPKGLYVLEAALVGVPSLLPSHGAFPELIADLGAGTLYSPSDDQDLVLKLGEICRSQVSGRVPAAAVRAGLRESVIQKHSIQTTGPVLAAVLQEFIV